MKNNDISKNIKNQAWRISALGLAFAFALSGCASSLPADTSSAAQSSSSSSSVAGGETITLSSPASIVNPGSTQQLQATGGTAPYVYSISGTAKSTIAAGTGVFTAGPSAETVTVMVVDATNASATTSIVVLAAATSLVNVYQSANSTGNDHLFSLSSTEGPNAGYTAQGAAFSVFSTKVAGSSPLYRCVATNNGHHFLSLSSNCEGQNAPEGILGYVTGGGVTGESMQLYRFTYTLSTGETQFEATNLAYWEGVGLTYNGSLGYVGAPL